MLECAGRIDEYVGGDETRFRASRLVQDAVVRNLQTLAESSQRLTDAIKASEPDVPWRAISGFRNILVHDYLAIDVDAVWLVVDQELPRLHAALQRMATRLQVERAGETSAVGQARKSPPGVSAAGFGLRLGGVG
ncbi:MAG: HepT-like ribonuclease domain-containing protein [Thauera sp.]